MYTDNAWFFTLLVILETAHVVSPFVLSGMHRELRSVVWRRRLWLPPAVWGAVFLTAGLTVLPVQKLVLAYLLWNAWHFTMQNFGVLQLINPKRRRTNFLIAFIGNAVGFWASPLVMQAHHWLTDIGLSCRVSKRRLLFLFAILAVTPAAILWNKTPWRLFDMQMPFVLIEFGKALMVFRFALSFAHFAFEANTWKLGDPQIRAAIGPALFSQPDARASARISGDKLNPRVA